MSVLNIVLFCAAGFLLGIVISWLVSNIVSRIRNRTARRRVEPQMNVKKGIKTMDLILVIIGVSLVWFTHRMLTLYETTGGIPDTLCQCVFALLGGECGVMGWIKTTKDKQQDRKWAEEERRRRQNRQADWEYTEGAENRQTPPEARPKGYQSNRLLAALSYIPALFLLPSIFCSNDKFALYHARQGLILFAVTAAGQILGSAFGLGWIVGLMQIYWIIKGISNANAGKMEPLPYIGNLFFKDK